MKKNVVVFGKGDLAVKVAGWFKDSIDYDLVAVVPNQPPSVWTANLGDWAKINNVPFVASGHFNDVFQELKEGVGIDLAVSVTYDKIFKQDFIARCGKIINIHNGPLPQYRGVNPINWALKNNENEHGVTIHEILPGIDNGSIIGMVKFPINPVVDEVIDVYERALNFGWKLFKEVMPNLWAIKPVVQDESQARYYSAKDFSKLGDRSYFTRKESLAKLADQTNG